MSIRIPILPDDQEVDEDSLVPTDTRVDTSVVLSSFL